jgi:starvation-inducible DNA-binding protein
MDSVDSIADRLGAYGAAVQAEADTAVELEDQDTADLFTEVSRAIDKDLWFVVAHLRPDRAS